MNSEIKNITLTLNLILCMSFIGSTSLFAIGSGKAGLIWIGIASTILSILINFILIRRLPRISNKSKSKKSILLENKILINYIRSILLKNKHSIESMGLIIIGNTIVTGSSVVIVILGTIENESMRLFTTLIMILSWGMSTIFGFLGNMKLRSIFFKIGSEKRHYLPETILLRLEEEQKTRSKNLAVSLLLAYKKFIHTVSLTFSLFICGVLYYFWTTVSNQSIQKEILIILAITISALGYRQYLLHHRTKQSDYGDNRHEAQELITFIDQESEKSDFTGGGGKRKIFADTKKEEIITSLTGQEVYDG